MIFQCKIKTNTPFVISVATTQKSQPQSCSVQMSERREREPQGPDTGKFKLDLSTSHCCSLLNTNSFAKEEEEIV